MVNNYILVIIVVIIMVINYILVIILVIIIIINYILVITLVIYQLHTSSNNNNQCYRYYSVNN